MTPLEIKHENTYWHILKKEYFALTGEIEKTAEQSFFLINNWAPIVKKEAQVGLSKDQFIAKYQLRFKLIRPLENLK